MARYKEFFNPVVWITVLLLAGSVLVCPPVFAQKWPQRPIRIVVPFNAGGATDVITRIVMERVSRQMNHAVVVENKGGAAGTIGVDYVAKVAPDGYTFLMGTTGTNITCEFFVKNVPYETTKDFRGVAMVAGIANLLVVHPSVPAKSLAEFIAYAKAHPGKLNYAATGSGSRMAMELFLQRAGIDVTMIPYRGSAPALQDLVKGDVQATMDLFSSTLPAVESGQLRALAISTKARSSRAPNVPTLDESGVKGYEFISWQGVFAPKQTPAGIINPFSSEINKALAAPEVKQRVQDMGAEPMGGPPEQMDAYIKSEIAKLTAVAKAANIRPE
jgi:tripartite-type tricarboxylate transporter receptor subunit TctC